MTAARSLGKRIAAVWPPHIATSATKGWTLRGSKTHWIAGSAVAASFGGTILAAVLEVSLHWHMAVVLGAALISGGAYTYAADARAKARDARRRAAEAAAIDSGVSRVCKAIETATADHAVRMEKATAGHGERLRSDVFTIESLMATIHRGEIMAHLDAEREAEARKERNDTGPLPVVR